MRLVSPDGPVYSVIVAPGYCVRMSLRRRSCSGNRYRATGASPRIGRCSAGLNRSSTGLLGSKKASVGVLCVASEMNTRVPAGNAAMARCDVLPAYYVVQDETVRAGGAGSGVNVWAAGDAAVARYFNELSRRCAPTR